MDYFTCPHAGGNNPQCLFFIRRGEFHPAGDAGRVMTFKNK